VNSASDMEPVIVRNTSVAEVDSFTVDLVLTVTYVQHVTSGKREIQIGILQLLGDPSEETPLEQMTDAQVVIDHIWILDGPASQLADVDNPREKCSPLRSVLLAPGPSTSDSTISTVGALFKETLRRTYLSWYDKCPLLYPHVSFDELCDLVVHKATLLNYGKCSYYFPGFVYEPNRIESSTGSISYSVGKKDMLEFGILVVERAIWKIYVNTLRRKYGESLFPRLYWSLNIRSGVFGVAGFKIQLQYLENYDLMRYNSAFCICRTSGEFWSAIAVCFSMVKGAVVGADPALGPFSVNSLD